MEWKCLEDGIRWVISQGIGKGGARSCTNGSVMPWIHGCQAVQKGKPHPEASANTTTKEQSWGLTYDAGEPMSREKRD
jgi:hypothetical protein